MSKLDVFMEDLDARFDQVFEMLDLVLAELRKKADQTTVDEVLRHLNTIELVVKQHSDQLTALEVS